MENLESLCLDNVDKHSVDKFIKEEKYEKLSSFSLRNIGNNIPTRTESDILTDDDKGKIINNLSFQQNLKSIDLSGNNLSFSTKLLYLSKLTRLSSIVLKDCNLTSTNNENFLLFGYSNFNFVKSLDVSNNNLGVSGAEKLLNKFGSWMPNLKELNLTNTGLTLNDLENEFYVVIEKVLDKDIEINVYHSSLERKTAESVISGLNEHSKKVNSKINFIFRSPKEIQEDSMEEDNDSSCYKKFKEITKLDTATWGNEIPQAQEDENKMKDE
ncbi:MAG TPA: hypothetical protein VI959_02575 [Alphaproteobacteria bacterium]|nr:hypothetical protein [Alphaproteobacteria bacterium]